MRWAAFSAVHRIVSVHAVVELRKDVHDFHHLTGHYLRLFDFDLSDVLEMRFEDSELQEYSLFTGDVLICEGGEPGRAAVWDGRRAGIYFQKAVHRVRFGSRVNPHFFVLALRDSADDEGSRQVSRAQESIT